MPSFVACSPMVWPKPYRPSTTAMASFSKTILMFWLASTLPALQPVDVVGHSDHAVRVVADEVRFDQIMADALGFLRVAAGRGKDGRDESLQSFVVDFHGVRRLLLEADKFLQRVAVRATDAVGCPPAET